VLVDRIRGGTKSLFAIVMGNHRARLFRWNLHVLTILKTLK